MRGCLIAAMGLMCGRMPGIEIRLAAQSTSPVSGVAGPIVLEGTVDQEYAAANTVVVKTIDGARHVFHYTTRLLVHGGRGSGIDALSGLRAGTTVAVHYTVAGGNASAIEIDLLEAGGLLVTEGMVSRIDRGRKHIAIRFDDGRTETFQLTGPAAADAGRETDRQPGARVIVYYADEGGRKVAHFFKKTS